MTKSFFKIFIFTFLVLSSSCTPATIGSGGGVVLSAAQERSFSDAAQDSKIWTKIKNAFFQSDVNRIFTPITVKVSEGRVLLNGKVPDADAKIEAIRLSWSIDGVKEVISEIKINDKNNHFSIRQYAADSFITSQIKSKLLIEKDLRSINYTIDTIDQIVYILGIAQDEAELDRVTEISRTVRGVKQVLNYARVKNHHLRKK